MSAPGNIGRPESCQNCRWWKGDKTDRNRKDGRPNSGTCRRGAQPKTTGRLHACEQIKLVFVRPDYERIQLEADAHWQAVCEWRMQHGNAGPLDLDAVRQRARKIFETFAHNGRSAKGKAKVAQQNKPQESEQ